MKLRRQDLPGLCLSADICTRPTSSAFASVLQNHSYAQHKVSSGKSPIDSACMMPPQAISSKSPSKAWIESNVEKCRRRIQIPWTEDIEAMVQSHLKARGIGVTSAANPLSESRICRRNQRGDRPGPAEVQSCLRLDVQETQSDRQVGLHSRRSGLGMLPCSENADIVVFVQAYGQVVTNSPGDSAELYVTMADAKTGESRFYQAYPDGIVFLQAQNPYFGPGPRH